MSKTMFVSVKQDRNGNLTATFAKARGRSPKYPLSFSRYRALVNGSGHHMADDDEFAILLFPKEKRAQPPRALDAPGSACEHGYLRAKCPMCNHLSHKAARQ